jgi:3-oxoacyl-[acyl-carrier protein] reductase
MTSGDRLAEKTAIVTGAASGIGRATLARFISEGARVVAVDRDEAALERAIMELGAAASAYAADITDPSAMAALAAHVLAQHGGIDILAHFAGITKDALYQKMSLDDWNAVIHVNLTGTFVVAQAIAPLMRDGGAIVLTSSRSYFGNIGQANYAASKGGVVSLTRTLALELGKRGIRVNAIAPGFIETPMTSVVPDKLRDRAIEQTPLKRTGKPEEIASVALFLASSDSSYLTGQVICADGGRTVGLAPI